MIRRSHSPARRVLLTTAALALAATLAGCSHSAGAPLESAAAAPPAEGSKGRLVIIGGALSSNNATIYNRMVELSGDGRIAVLPTASGVPLESGPGAVETFNRYGGEGRAYVVDITMEDYSQAANPEKAAAIRDSAGVFFTGGDQNRILAAFRPATGDTISYAALHEVLARGGWIGGSSAGAAMMSDPIIGGGRSDTALRFGVIGEDAGEEGERGVMVTRGMALFPFGITDQHFLARGRLGRLIVALEHTGVARGYGIDENAAIEVDLATGRITTLGNPRALLLADISEMTRTGDNRTDIRIAMLGNGDYVDGHTGQAFPAADKSPFQPASDASGAQPIMENIWGRDVIPALIVALANSHADSALGKGGQYNVLFTRDERTSFQIGPDGSPGSITVIGLRMDLLKVGDGE